MLVIKLVLVILHVLRKIRISILSFGVVEIVHLYFWKIPIRAFELRNYKINPWLTWVLSLDCLWMNPQVLGLILGDFRGLKLSFRHWKWIICVFVVAEEEKGQIRTLCPTPRLQATGIPVECIFVWFVSRFVLDAKHGLGVYLRDLMGWF